MPRPLAAAALLALTLALGALPPRPAGAIAGAGGERLEAARPAWLLSATSAGPPKGAASQAPATYIIVLEEPPLASYAGGKPGLAATSPRARGEARLDTRSRAALAYLDHLDGRQRALIARLAAVAGRPLAAARSYRYALNGLALSLSPAEAAAAEALPGVLLVRRAEERARASDAGPALIGAAQADLRPALFTARLGAAGAAAAGRAIVTYDAATRRLGLRLDFAGLSGPPTGTRLAAAGPGLSGAVALDLDPLAAPGGGAYAGEISLAGGPDLSAEDAERALLRGELDIVVTTAAAPDGEIGGRLRPVRGEGVVGGVIDGGIAADHPSFADVGGDGHNHANPRGALLGVCAPGAGGSPAFPCNDKLIGAYTFPATASVPDPAGRPSPFDDDGHGSHTAATFAGNVTAASAVAGVATGPIAGVAPHASLVVYDVCGTGSGSGCPMDAIVEAIDRAAADGVQVVNYSISGFPGDPWGEPDALAFLGALDAGVLAAVAAGNAGPAAGSVGAPANAPWVMSVGASTHARRFTRVLGDFAGGALPPPPPLAGAGFGLDAAPPARILDAAQLRDGLGEPNPFCLPFQQGERLDGAIVVCRQLLPPEVVAEYAAAAGAGGLVILWPADVGSQIVVDALPIPAVQLDSEAGAALSAWLAAGSGHVAGIGPAARDGGGQADSVAWFSSRGPNRPVPGVLKPDLTAPGVNILAASTEFTPGADDYAFLSGTSMATPHAAGAAALLRQIHPGWSAQEIRSALMTTAQPELTTQRGERVTPHDAGAGRIRVGLAARAGLLLDETTARFRAADPARGGDPAALNLPSLSSGSCLEQCVFTRTVRSSLATPATWEATSAAGPLLALDVQPQRFTLAPGAEQTLVITARVGLDGFAPPGTFRFGAVTLTEQSGLAPPARLPVALDAPSAILPPAIVVRAAEPAGTTRTAPLRTVGTPELTLRVLGPTRGAQSTLRVAEDPTPFDPLDGTAGVATTSITVPRGAPRVLVAVQGTSADDVDLFVFADGEGGAADGVAQAGELICVSAGYAAVESCDLILDGSGGRRLIAMVQSYSGSGAAEDTVELLVGIVPGEVGAGLRAGGPGAVSAGTPFGVEVAWELSGGRGDAGRHLAVLQVSSSPDPADAGDLGAVPLDLIYMPERLYWPIAAP